MQVTGWFWPTQTNTNKDPVLKMRARPKSWSFATGRSMRWDDLRTWGEVPRFRIYLTKGCQGWSCLNWSPRAHCRWSRRTVRGRTTVYTCSGWTPAQCARLSSPSSALVPLSSSCVWIRRPRKPPKQQFWFVILSDVSLFYFSVGSASWRFTSLEVSSTREWLLELKGWSSSQITHSGWRLGIWQRWGRCNEEIASKEAEFDPKISSFHLSGWLWLCVPL